MADLWTVNPVMPRPFPQHLMDLREAAIEKWGRDHLSEADILTWIYAGCPNAAGALLHPATHQPPLPGQGSASPEETMVAWLKRGVFVPAE